MSPYWYHGARCAQAQADSPKAGEVRNSRRRGGPSIPERDCDGDAGSTVLVGYSRKTAARQQTMSALSASLSAARWRRVVT